MGKTERWMIGNGKSHLAILSLKYLLASQGGYIKEIVFELRGKGLFRCHFLYKAFPKCLLPIPLSLLSLLPTASIITSIVAFIKFMLHFPVYWSIFYVRLWADYGTEAIYILHFSPSGSFLAQCWQAALLTYSMHAYSKVVNSISYSSNYWKLFSKFSQNVPHSIFYSVEDIPRKLDVIKLLVWILTLIICLR